MMKVFFVTGIISGIILVAFGIVTNQTNLPQQVYAQTNDYNIAVGIPGKDIAGVDGVGAVYIYNGTSGSLLRIINNPEGNISGQFGQFVTYADNKLVVGAPHIKNTDNKTGAVYVFDGTSGSLLFTIRNPETSVSVHDGKTKYLSSEFGNSIAIAANRLAVGAPSKNFTNVVGSGSVYFFDEGNGSILFTKNNPDANQAQIFGDPIKSFENKFVFGMPRKNSTNDEVVGSVSVFNGTSGLPLFTVDDPEPQDSAQFGLAIALENKTLAVGAPQRTVDENQNAGAVYLFDGETDSLLVEPGSLLGMIYNPDPADDDLFGSSVTFLGKNIAVGAPGKGVVNSGAVYVFNSETLMLIKKISNPQVGLSYEFGSSIASMGDMLAVGAPGMHKEKNEKGGVVYLFNGTTGSLFHIINNTSPMVNDGFGNSLTFVGHVNPDPNLINLKESNIGNSSNSQISNATLITKDNVKISGSTQSERMIENNVTNSSQQEKDRTGKITGKLAPLKQFKSGTDPYFVNCRENLELVIKLRDNSPACVKPTSLERLLKQGWIYAYDNNGKYNRNGKSTAIDELSSTCENEFKPKDFEFTVFSNGTSHTVNYVPVFLMKPNSTGKICLNYWQTSSEMNYSGKVIIGIGKDNSDVQDVTVVANPDTITIDNTNKTIAYTITASKGSDGFYRFSPMFSNCGGIPIAIGYNSTRSFDNEFPWLWEKVPCMLEVAHYQITGLTGIDVAYITKEYG